MRSNQIAGLHLYHLYHLFYWLLRTLGFLKGDPSFHSASEQVDVTYLLVDIFVTAWDPVLSLHPLRNMRMYVRQRPQSEKYGVT